MKILKDNIQTLIIILFFAGYVQAQYAPWAKLSSDAPKEIDMRKYPVPTIEEVGIPPYPGSVISSVSAPKEDTVKYEREILPFLNLVTSDPPSNVIAFYKRTLTKDKGWNYSEEYKTFIKGENQGALTGFIPTVKIRDESGNNYDLVYVDPNYKKNLKTRIEIKYKSPK
jgi:hypothetical protein